MGLDIRDIWWKIHNANGWSRWVSKGDLQLSCILPITFMCPIWRRIAYKWKTFAGVLYGSIEKALILYWLTDAWQLNMVCRYSLVLFHFTISTICQFEKYHFNFPVPRFHCAESVASKYKKKKKSWIIRRREKWVHF